MAEEELLEDELLLEELLLEELLLEELLLEDPKITFAQVAPALVIVSSANWTGVPAVRAAVVRGIRSA